MADGVKMELNGDKQLKHLFVELPNRAKSRGLRAAANAGGTVIARAVRKNIPQDSGLLKKSIKKKVKVYRDTATGVAVIGADKDAKGEVRGNLRVPANYLHLVERGAKPHSYKTRKGMHPGFAGKHMIEQAEQTQGAAALEAAQSKLAEVIEREAEKLSK